MRRGSGRGLVWGQWPTQVLGLVGVVATVVGLAVVPESLAFDLRGSFDGIGSQLPVTLRAAALTLGASLANLLAGAAILRLLRGRPFSSIGALLLGGFVGAVLLDVGLLCLLGAAGLFTGPILFVVHAGILVAAWPARRHLLTDIRFRFPRVSLLGAFVIVGWSAPVLLQLASPVVPFLDVLPNHVAPVEHLRTFGTFDPLTTAPSPVYGPSRTSLGYVGVLGAVSVMTDLGAALTVSAFIVVEVCLVALAVHRLATTVGGPSAGGWMLVTFMLTQAFARLADDRARILALPLAAWTLAEFVRATRVPSDDPPGPGALELRRVLLLVAGLAATILMHAVIGSFTAATLLALGLVGSRRSFGLAVTTVAAGTALALLQLLSMVVIPLPAYVGLLSVLAAGLVLVGMRAAPARRAALALCWGVVVVGAIAVIAYAPRVVDGAVSWGAEFLPSTPILLAMAFVAVFLSRRRATAPILWAPILVGTAAATVALALPADSPSALVQAIRFEIPKEAHSWVPTFLAIAAAIAVARLLSSVRPVLPRSVGFVAVAVFVAVGSLPLRADAIDPFSVGEHRVSENLAIHLRHTERGFWVGYPSSRHVVDAAGESLLQAVRREVEAGRIGPTTSLLHVAASYQHSASIPVGVFTGVLETTVSRDASETFLTAGGRLRPLADLDRLLASSDPLFAYVLLEPRGLDRDVRQRIVDAGYRPIHESARGELFAWRDR